MTEAKQKFEEDSAKHQQPSLQRRVQRGWSCGGGADGGAATKVQGGETKEGKAIVKTLVLFYHDQNQTGGVR